MKHYHYEINTFNYKFPYIKGQLSKELEKIEFQMGEAALVSVQANSEEEAMEKSKTIIKRKFYRLMKVYDCHLSEPLIDPQELQITQLEIQKKTLDFLKGNG